MHEREKDKLKIGGFYELEMLGQNHDAFCFLKPGSMCPTVTRSRRIALSIMDDMKPHWSAKGSQGATGELMTWQISSIVLTEIQRAVKKGILIPLAIGEENTLDTSYR